VSRISFTKLLLFLNFFTAMMMVVLMCSFLLYHLVVVVCGGYIYIWIYCVYNIYNVSHTVPV
jgi:hypothetical protein